MANININREPSAAVCAGSDVIDYDEFLQHKTEKTIRVGPDHQVVIPKLQLLPTPRLEEQFEKSLLLWAPTDKITEEKLKEYLFTAKEKYGWCCEEASSMLYSHNYDLDKALGDLANIPPLPDDWTTVDKLTFISAFQEDNFERIKQMLPDKPISTLEEYSHLWMNKRKQNNLLDGQTKRLGSFRSNENQNGSVVGSSSAESEPNDKVTRRGLSSDQV